VAAADIERSGGTPELERGSPLKTRIGATLTPKVRDREEWVVDGRTQWNPPEVLGDVLDTPPQDCTFITWWWSRKNGNVGLMRRPCRTRTCAACAPEYLAERVAPAVAVWGDRALRAEYASQGEWKWEREKMSLQMRGPRAESGVLVIRLAGKVVVWAPVHVGLDGAVLSGRRRRDQLVADLRAIPFPEPEHGSGDDPPVRNAGIARTVARVEWAAEQVGIALVAGKRSYATAPAEDEQGAAFAELMRRR
jgi:hypothetical protein